MDDLSYENCDPLTLKKKGMHMPSYSYKNRKEHAFSMNYHENVSIGLNLRRNVFYDPYNVFYDPYNIQIIVYRALYHMLYFQYSWQY